MSGFELRRAVPQDAASAAEVWLQSRRAAAKYIPSLIHTDDETREWTSSHVLPDLECWVAETPAGEIIGLLVLRADWVEQLYVSPARQGRGVGGALIELAKRLRPDGLQLWTFGSNMPARRFYEAPRVRLCRGDRWLGQRRTCPRYAVRVPAATGISPDFRSVAHRAVMARLLLRKFVDPNRNSPARAFAPSDSAFLEPALRHGRPGTTRRWSAAWLRPGGRPCSGGAVQALTLWCKPR